MARICARRAGARPGGRCQIRAIVAYLAASLDGFIAGPDDDLTWLPALTPAESGYDAFFAGVGALILGRRTYEVVQSLGEWPYAEVPAFVLSHSLVPGASGPATVTAESPAALAQRLRGGPADTGVVWLVGGAGVFAAFAAADLIDQWIVTVVPVILAAGTPLVTPGTPRQDLALAETRQLPAGCVQLRYTALRSSV